MEDLTLQPGEKVIIAVRKHWLVLVGMTIPFLLLAFIPEIFLFLFSSGGIFANTPVAPYFSVDYPFTRFLLGAWWLFVWMAYFGNFMHDHLDIWIITNKRLIDVEQVSFFKREVHSVYLNNVQDVTHNAKGFFETIFHFGTIQVSSAGAKAVFQLRYIDDPERVRDLLMAEIAKFSVAGEHKQSPTTTLANEVEKVLGI